MRFKDMRSLGMIPRKSDREFSNIQKSLRRQRAQELVELREKQRPLVAALRAAQREHQRQAAAEAEERRQAAIFAMAAQRSERMVGSATCYWCGLRYDPLHPWFRRTREHLVPRSNGGRNSQSNVVGAHSRCNNQRGVDMRWQPFSQHGVLGKRVPFDDERPHLRLPNEHRDTLAPVAIS